MTSVTALVCTRNRPKQITEAVRSLLEGEGAFELIVIDQSTGRETETELAVWQNHPRFKYHRTATKGKGAGLNEGLGLAQGSVIVLTDDDCAVPRSWVTDMARALDAHPQVAILFCNVVPVPHDRDAGYVPAHERVTPRLTTSVAGLAHGLGLGAGMAIRKDVALALGGFDESFGPGARFPSADEWDLCIRALLAGWHVYETPELAVLHDGFRSFEEGLLHARRDWVALGAVWTKPMRAQGLGATLVLLEFLREKAIWPPLSDLLHARRPRGIGRISSFCRGFASGLRTPMDPKTLRFVPPK